MSDELNTASERLVLVVDDDAAFLMWAEYILSQNGYAVRCAETVESARKVIEEEIPSLVLIDVHLGPENGLELLNVLQEAPRPIPSLVVTGYAELDVALAALRGGAFDLVVKPVRTGEFLQSVSDALDDGAASRNRQLLDRVLEQSHHGLLIVDSGGVVTSVAGAPEELLGHGIAGQSLETVLDARRADREATRQIVQAMKNGLDSTVVLTLLDAAGDVRAIRLSTRPIVNGREADPVAWLRIDVISAVEASVVLAETNAHAQARLASGTSGLRSGAVGDALDAGRIGLYGRSFESVGLDESQRLILVEPRLGNAQNGDGQLDRSVLDVETNQLLDSWTLGSLAQAASRIDADNVSFVVSLYDLPESGTSDFELLEAALDSLSRQNIHVVVDVDHYHIVEHEEAVRELLDMARFHGHSACVRNFGLSALSVANLKDWPVEYLAIAPAFTRQLRVDTVDHALVRTMAEIASVFGKKTLAQDVVYTEQFESLLLTGVNYLCGELIGAAVPLLPIPGVRGAVPTSNAG